jgi:endonuclease I
MRFGLLVLGVMPALAWAQPPAGYYASAEGLSGQALQQALHGIIAPHTVLANSALWQAFTTTDARPDGTVWDIYSDVPGGEPPYVYQFGVDQCGTYSAEGHCFNREHSFPQSWYGSQAPMSTDLFHIYPVDAWVNQQRANWPYGTVPAPSWTSSNGGRLGPCGAPGCPGTVFEPIDAYKGDLARSMFYMFTRYRPHLPSWTSCPILENGEPAPWAMALLLAWHELDPVSDKERARQEAVFALQGNRNPYIDQPEWAQQSWVPGAFVAEHEGVSPWCWVHEGLLYSGLPEGSALTVDLFDTQGRLLGTWSGIAPPMAIGAAGQGIAIAVVAAGDRRAVLRVPY